MAETEPARPAPSVWVQFGVLLLVFLGSGLLGAAVAEWLAPGWFLAGVAGLFMLPMSFMVGLVFWQGVAIIKLLFRLPLLLFRRGKAPAASSFDTPPGAGVFVPVSLFFGLVGGLVIGLMPGGSGILAAIGWGGLLGVGYGFAVWQLAQRGYIAFPEEFVL